MLKVKAHERQIKKGMKSLGERPKNLFWEDSEWEVYLGTNAYTSVKAREWQCIVWLCVIYPHAFY